MSVCQYVRMQLFSLGIKIKVVHNVIRMSDSQKILVRKSLRTAKEPALVSMYFYLIINFDFLSRVKKSILNQTLRRVSRKMRSSTLHPHRLGIISRLSNNLLWRLHDLMRKVHPRLATVLQATTRKLVCRSWIIGNIDYHLNP